MSKVWEFAVSTGRLAIVAGCLALAILIAGSAGFAAGVLLAPRFASGKTALAASKAKPVAGKAVPPKPEPVVAHAAREENAAKPLEGKPASPKEAGPVKQVPPIQLDVQVASFSDETKAQATVDRLKRSGYPAFAFQWTDADSRNWHVVQVGPYAAYETASGVVLELATRYRLDPVIIPAKSF
ncbi:MAG: hypothetical protein QOJ99_2150 [Bryobacterales bacterium]|jgi:cell division septation protein DedD|nr:hypothetical protein [Bryobacterales bacterium]